MVEWLLHGLRVPAERRHYHMLIAAQRGKPSIENAQLLELIFAVTVPHELYSIPTLNWEDP